MSFRAFVGCLVAATLLFAGCSQKKEATTEETLPEVTTTTVDLWAVPPTIDAAYAQRVIQKLTDVNGEVRAKVFDTQSFNEDSKEKLKAVYAEPLLTLQMQAFSDASTRSYPDVKRAAKASLIQVKDLLSASGNCMYASGTVDDSAAHVSPQVPTEVVWALEHSDGYESGVNPTGWKLTEETGKQLTKGNPCVG